MIVVSAYYVQFDGTHKRV